jgi:hypothetical protein
MGTAPGMADLLRSPALLLLLDLAADGVHARLDGDEVLLSPPERVTPAQREVLAQHLDAARALVPLLTQPEVDKRALATALEVVQSRLDAFRVQVGAAPVETTPAFLFKADVPYVPFSCFSCGDDTGLSTYGRCWNCKLAMRLASRLPMAADLAAVMDSSRVVA